MEEFNSIKKNIYPETLKLRDLEIGTYTLISLRKINTKFGDSLIVRLEINDVEKDFYLSKSHGELSDKAIKKINKGKYLFVFRGKINDKYYDYELESA